MKRMFAMGLGIVGLSTALLAGAGPAMAGNTLSVTVVGGWQGLGSTRTEAKSGCYSKDSIDAGAKVKVVNESGKIVGIGSLRWKTVGSASDGFADGSDPDHEFETIRFAYDCVLIASFPVGSAQFYDITMNGVDAGQYSAGELRKDKWKLNLSFS